MTNEEINKKIFEIACGYGCHPMPTAGVDYFKDQYEFSIVLMSLRPHIRSKYRVHLEKICGGYEQATYANPDQKCKALLMSVGIFDIE